MSSSSPPTLRGLKTVGRVVDRRIAVLQTRLLDRSGANRSGAVAALARLRRGLGKPPGAVLDVIEHIVSEEFEVPGHPHATERHERAANLAITLYAGHQQSQNEPMHRRGRGLGTALRALHKGGPSDLPAPLVHRFRLLGTADSFSELSYHLRGAVQLLRAGKEAVDYGVLADQLVDWQRFGPDQIQLTWGREFYRSPRSESAGRRDTAAGSDPTTT